MTSIFRVLEVYRPAERRGPVLVGEMPDTRVTVGTRLVLSSDRSVGVEVLAVDLPTERSLAERRLAVVVTPDVGELLRPGATFEIFTSDP